MKHAIEPHEALFERLTLGPANEDPETFLTELVAASSLSEDDRAFLLEQGPNRLLVYRRLVRNTLRETLELARLCETALWIDNGRVREAGDVADVIRAYRRATRLEKDSMSRFSAT